MTPKKIGVSDLLDIMVYPFGMPFDVELFAAHMLRRTTHLFLQTGRVERSFVAITAIDFETQKGPATLSIIVPKWSAERREEIFADVREYLAKTRGVAVSSQTEDDDGVYITIEWNRQRTAFAAMKIRDSEGDFVLGQWQRVAAGVALPLLPASPDAVTS
jgi:hypothetical protein